MPDPFAGRTMPGTETPALPGPRIICHVGDTGCGKTYHSRVEWFRSKFALAVDSQVFDGVGEYPGAVARSFDELSSIFERAQAQALDTLRVSYSGPVRESDSGPDIFDVASMIRGLSLFVEEADKFMDAHSSPDGIYSMAHHGRRLGQRLIINARRFAAIDRDLTAIATELRVWTPGEPLDWDAARGRGFREEWFSGFGPQDFIRRTKTGGLLRFSTYRRK